MVCRRMIGLGSHEEALRQRGFTVSGWPVASPGASSGSGRPRDPPGHRKRHDFICLLERVPVAGTEALPADRVVRRPLPSLSRFLESRLVVIRESRPARDLGRVLLQAPPTSSTAFSSCGSWPSRTAWSRQSGQRPAP
jgi:hypothetical protein